LLFLYWSFVFPTSFIKSRNAGPFCYPSLNSEHECWTIDYGRSIMPSCQIRSINPTHTSSLFRKPMFVLIGWYRSYMYISIFGGICLWSSFWCRTKNHI